jgi:hypothetical protein
MCIGGLIEDAAILSRTTALVHLQTSYSKEYAIDNYSHRHKERYAARPAADIAQGSEKRVTAEGGMEGLTSRSNGGYSAGAHPQNDGAALPGSSGWTKPIRPSLFQLIGRSAKNNPPALSIAAFSDHITGLAGHLADCT